MKSLRIAPLALCAIALLLTVLTGPALHQVKADDGPGDADEDGATWKDRLAGELPQLGHRNWIVVADSAYPAQTRPGIETIYIGGSHLEAIHTVLTAIDAAKHVQAAPLVDTELGVLTNKDIPRIEEFRERLKKMMEDRPVGTMPHEDIIKRLDEEARKYRVLVFKTDITVPYTSVFIQLECGYWDAEKESRIRRTLGRGNN